MGEEVGGEGFEGCGVGVGFWGADCGGHDWVEAEGLRFWRMIN